MTTSEPYRHCDLYVEARSPQEVKAEVTAHFGVRQDGLSFPLPAATLSVSYGCEWPGLPDHFYGWRGYIDVTAEPHATDTEVVALGIELMELVRSHGHRVVAECGFADELPQDDLAGILARGWPGSVEEPREVTYERWQGWHREVGADWHREQRDARRRRRREVWHRLRRAVSTRR